MLVDAFDRCWMILVIQIYFIAVSAQRVWRARGGWRPHRLGRVTLVLQPTFTFAVGQGRPCCNHARAVQPRTWSLPASTHSPSVDAPRPADSRQPTADSRQPTADSRQHQLPSTALGDVSRQAPSRRVRTALLRN